MTTPEQLGCDAKSCEMLRALPYDQQEFALEKLRQGIEGGKVRNPSGYVAGVIHNVEILALAGVDERAQQMLKELPDAGRKAVIQKFRQAQEVRNPSAWIAKAVLTQKREGGMGMGMGMGMNMGMNMGMMGGQPMGMGGGMGLNCLDAKAQGLLKSLPKEAQAQILGQLVLQGNVNNPSAWVAKAALTAGATSSAMHSGPPPDAGQGATEPYYGFDPQVATLLAPFPLDTGARTMLQQLPLNAQVDIASRLVTQSDIKNPSGWVVKACMTAGAKGPPRAAQAGGAMGMGGYGAAQMAQSGPVTLPAGCVVDANAQNLLQTLPEHAQRDIIMKLINSFNMGSVSNPSAWVAKACMKAGANTTPGMGAMGGGMRYSPY